MHLHRTAIAIIFDLSLSLVHAQSPLILETTIPLPGVHGRIDHMAFDPEHNRLFVSALGTDALAVVDLQTGVVVHTITGLAEPQGIGFDPDHNRLWIANGRDGSVRVFDGQNFNQLWTHSLGDDADNIRRDSSTGHMLVGYGSGGIAVFDADGKQLADTKLDAHPESFQLESAGSRIFVNLPQSHKIAVIDRSSSRAVATWATDGASANFPMALDQADNRILVVCRNPAVLLVIDAASGRIIQKLPTVGDSDDLFYDSTLRRIYVSGGEGAISIYQQEGADRYSPIAQLTTTSGARTSLFVPSLNRLFLAVREHEGKTAAIEVFAVGK